MMVAASSGVAAPFEGWAIPTPMGKTSSAHTSATIDRCFHVFMGVACIDISFVICAVLSSPNVNLAQILAARKAVPNRLMPYWSGRSARRPADRPNGVAGAMRLIGQGEKGHGRCHLKGTQR